MHGDVLKKQRVKKNGDMYSSKENEVSKLSSFLPDSIYFEEALVYAHSKFDSRLMTLTLQYGGMMLLLVTSWPITTAVSGKMFLMLTILAFLLFNYRKAPALRTFEIIRSFCRKIFNPL
jgi:hypothetical protein